jgi:hypothetical protein
MILHKKEEYEQPDGQLGSSASKIAATLRQLSVHNSVMPTLSKNLYLNILRLNREWKF